MQIHLSGSRCFVEPFKEGSDVKSKSGQEGIGAYGNWCGWILSWLGYAAQIKDQDHAFYINVKSAIYWIKNHGETFDKASDTIQAKLEAVARKALKKEENKPSQDTEKQEQKLTSETTNKAIGQPEKTTEEAELEEEKKPSETTEKEEKKLDPEKNPTAIVVEDPSVQPEKITEDPPLTDDADPLHEQSLKTTSVSLKDKDQPSKISLDTIIESALKNCNDPKFFTEFHQLITQESSNIKLDDLIQFSNKQKENKPFHAKLLAYVAWRQLESGEKGGLSQLITGFGLVDDDPIKDERTIYAQNLALLCQTEHAGIILDSFDFNQRLGTVFLQTILSSHDTQKIKSAFGTFWMSWSWREDDFYYRFGSSKFDSSGAGCSKVILSYIDSEDVLRAVWSAVPESDLKGKILQFLLSKQVYNNFGKKEEYEIKTDVETTAKALELEIVKKLPNPVYVVEDDDDNLIREETKEESERREKWKTFTQVDFKGKSFWVSKKLGI